MNFSKLEIKTFHLARHIQANPNDRAARAKFNQMPVEYRAKHTLPAGKSNLSTTDQFARMARQTAQAMGWQ